MRDHPDDARFADQVWAEEGSVMVRFDRVGVGGQVVITILDVSGREDREIAHATLGGWRWDRVVKALGIPVDVPR